MSISEGSVKSEIDNANPTALQENDPFWFTVNKRLIRPVGLLLFVVGIFMEIIFDLGVVEHKRGSGTIIFVGLLLILISVIYERYREWLTDPYKGVYR
tara:strand:+ start:15863 stop:16156 length:294 start_codon:yes stop_codon:yes gene_type:complete